MAMTALAPSKADANPLALEQMDPALRARIEDAIELLVAVLDAADPDPDLEPEQDACEAGDDGCGYAWLGGRSAWGSSYEGEGLRVPEYGVDQSAGPINEREELRRHFLEMRQA